MRSDVAQALLLHGHLRLPAQVGTGDPADLLGPVDLAAIAAAATPTPGVDVQVVIPWDTLTGTPACGHRAGRPGRGDHPAGQQGAGAVGEVLGRHGVFLTPAQARAVACAPGTVLHRLLIDPADGRLIERSRRWYAPDQAMRTHVHVADVTSRAPGSRHPATACDLDHEVPWPTGPTSVANLNAKDRSHHGFKTRRWRSSTMARTGT